ncbi:hypothetical protein A2Z53_02665 [Candidatus Giovannonibacteria bacterium RIFCSPHIGHO2_02_42_15]|nr:MAG: hypothetical protein A2Z53_02665 [Candidatus Giovannonibacteria bacterium RIFCSPHIGHO2_02_42_15]
MAKSDKRLLALKFRRQGWSIKHIARHLKVAKSTASIWCRDLVLTPRQKSVLVEKAIKAGHYGRMKGANYNKEKKEQITQFFKDEGIKKISIISDREFLISGLSLYWAEGSKKDKLSFVNTEPGMILFMYKWFSEVMGVKKEDFMPRIFINEIHRRALIRS